MKRGIGIAQGVAFLIGTFMLGGSSCGAAPGDEMTGEAVLKKIDALYSQIQDLTVTLDIVADMERMKVPPMHATMYYKAPDKMHFDAKGFAFLPREGMGLALGRIGSRYKSEQLEREKIDGVEKFKLTLTPRGETPRARSLFLFVDPTRWTAERVESHLFGGRTMVVDIRHEQVEGFWLPALLTVTFTSTGADTAETTPFDQGAPVPPRQTFRAGTITIRYSDYKVNTGLSDDLFKKEGESPKR